MRSFPDRDPGSPDIRSARGYLLWLARDHLRSIVLGSVFAVVWTVAQGLSPAIVGKAIDEGVSARDTTALVWWGTAVLALGVVQALGSALQDRFALEVKIGAGYQTMQFVTRHACRLGAGLSKRVSTGDMVNVSVSDMTQIGTAMEVATRGVGAAAAIVAVASVMLLASWQIGLVVLVGVPVMLWITTQMIRPLHRRQEAYHERLRALTDQAIDIVHGLRVLRGIGGERVIERRYLERSQSTRHAAVRVAQLDSVLDGAKSLLPGMLVVLVVGLGAHQVLADRLTAGQLVAFYGYATFLAVPLRRLTLAVSHLMKAHVSAEHVTRLLRLEPELPLGPSETGTDVPTRPGLLIDPVSGVKAPPSSLTAVACASPADAGMVAERLGRYTDSEAVYHGRRLDALPLGTVRRRILVTRNDARFFAGPLRAELDPYDLGEGSQDSLLAAIDHACASDVVEALPGGLDAAVESGGRQFSGGQLQRLRLARALMADPEVLILVDPTSAVDAHTEARMAAHLRQTRTGRSTIVFTTSTMLLRQADRVSYVEDGKVVTEGPHHQMLEDVRYRSLVTREMGTA
ncbi:ABC transporter ATP-binding protein [Streptomyces sp. AK02-04a]|uniref:ABC transporter ATP-binding protein n=1 Tax=Streptomyces sp. AK02-04a TaxID=3028649 RepID=UPI0029BB5E73|nr:ABC transporter ATP-binding protein [Streptomyces sp. AK02-04a]MDX3762439.1 ABC transporter ATP-binding protein [Streptomyces sp. AK02-04a]